MSLIVAYGSLHQCTSGAKAADLTRVWRRASYVRSPEETGRAGLLWMCLTERSTRRSMLTALRDSTLISQHRNLFVWLFVFLDLWSAIDLPSLHAAISVRLISLFFLKTHAALQTMFPFILLKIWPIRSVVGVSVFGPTCVCTLFFIPLFCIYLYIHKLRFFVCVIQLWGSGESHTHTC